MVDRGGLNYPIRVRDEFSKTTEKFRQELRASKAEFRSFQKGLAASRGGSKSLRETAAASKALAAAQRDQARATKSTIRPLTAEEQRLKALALAAKQQTAREREAVRIRNAQAADARRRTAEEKRAAREAEQAARRRQRALEAVSAAEARALRVQQQSLAVQARAERERERQASRISRQQQRDAAARLAAVAEQQRRAEALAAQQLRSQRAERSAADRVNAQVQAERRLNRELFQREITLRQIELLRARARTQFAAGDILGGRRSLQQVRELQQGLQGAQKAASGLFFTFRRLVGVLALFTLARRGAQAFNDLVRSGLRFNDTIETSTIGIAGLVATLGDVRNGLGESVSQSEELGLALGIAREQIAKLRQDSLRTVATFEELLDTFQIAVGPGLAAGLNLDEIRELTVDISQAASALGVPQNQLAEEVRSLLSGTIQARTTRIATALGITNADIRRLRETGELFDFLEERFAGFAEAAERQARSTLSGISTLIRGATSELLGQAAQPLFEELLSLGNELFDEVITIRDEAGNIRPNPEAVDAFRSLFEALRDGLRSLREFGERLGFEGLQNLVGTIGSGLNIALQTAIGFAESLAATFTVVATVVRSVTSAFGLTAERVGLIAGFVGQALGAIVLFRGASRLLGIEWRAILGTIQKVSPALRSLVGPAAILVAGFAAIAKGVEFVLEKLFDVDLGIKDTVELVVLGLADAFNVVGAAVAKVAKAITTGFRNAIDDISTFAQSKLLRSQSIIASLFGDSKEAERLAAEELRILLERDNRVKARAVALNNDLARIDRERLANTEGLQSEIDKIIARRAAEDFKAEGFDSGFDAEKAAADAEAAAEAATTFVSTADKPIAELSEDLLKVGDAIERARLEFEQAGRTGGIEGFGGKVEGLFNEQEIENSERLRKIRGELASTEEKIAELRSQGVAEDAGELVSLLRDEADLRDAINIALAASNELALTRAATEAANLLPTLRDENALLQAQVAAEQAVTAARVNDVGARQQALLAAQTAVELARTEAELAREKADIEIDAIHRRVAAAPPGEERDALGQVLFALMERRNLEQAILDLKIQQLEKAREEADLVANGDLNQGIGEGLNQFAEEFSSQFNAGVRIARESLEAFASFASQAIVDIFDPTKDSDDIKQNFARLLQGIAQTILNELIKLAIAKAILGFKDGGVVPTLNVAGQAFDKGGRVRRKGDKRLPLHAFAQGFAGGGRASGISPLDTVPAMLRPGEFVVRKEAVDALGLGTLEAINGGNMPVTGSSAAEASSPSMGMQSGGLVADQLAATRAAGADGSDGTPTVLPVLVAQEREMGQLTAGGRNALLAFMRDNAGDISSLLDRERRR